MYDIIHMFIYRIVIYWPDGNICNNKMHMFSGYINTPTQSICYVIRSKKMPLFVGIKSTSLFPNIVKIGGH